jgi:D-xylose transport system permease protein
MAVTEEATSTTEGALAEVDTSRTGLLRRVWGSSRKATASFELDTRLFGMIAGLLVIWVLFNIASGGTFLTPRNIWNLTVQTSVVAIMATGMVLIIVSRNIDLSVGSMLGFVGMSMALLQAEILPKYFGFDQSYTWIVVLVAGILMGAVLGYLQGVIVAYAAVPSFIVTLGGLLIWRGLAWVLASGRTIAPMDSSFQLLGGGAKGSVGGTISWIIGGISCVGIVFLLINQRRRRAKFGFRVRPMWADVVLAVLGCAVVLFAVWFLNRYFMPEGLARAYAEDRGIDWPENGLEIPFGVANPVLIAIGTALVMAFIASRRRFGRYVFAIGGNPESAELTGIKTKRTVALTFALMGALVGLAAAVQIARLNSATSGLGTLQELYVIAAAVIGGTSLAGGIGTILGAVLGALLMQSLQSGMVLVGIETALQDVVVGVVLVLAVGVDVVYRRRQTT